MLSSSAGPRLSLRKAGILLFEFCFPASNPSKSNQNPKSHIGPQNSAPCRTQISALRPAVNARICTSAHLGSQDDTNDPTKSANPAADVCTFLDDFWCWISGLAACDFGFCFFICVYSLICLSAVSNRLSFTMFIDLLLILNESYLFISICIRFSEGIVNIMDHGKVTHAAWPNIFPQPSQAWKCRRAKQRTR